jgi:colanic acid biosynthesis glycosyl transferase WcaI
MRSRGWLRRRVRTDVCLLSMNYPPEPTGIAPYAGALARALRKAGRTVTAHVAHPHYPEWKVARGYGQWTRSEHLDGVHVRRRLHYVPKSPRGVRRLLSELSFGLRSVFSRWNRPEVVVAISPALFSTAMAALRIRLTPKPPVLIVWVQDIYTLGLAETGEGGGLSRRITRWVEATTLRAADRVIVIHQRFADFVTDQYGLDQGRVVVLRNWTHLPPSEPVDAASAKAALGWPESETLVVHTGNMGAKQALENVVEAARIADERRAPIRFILVGDGGERRKLEQHAQGVNRVTFVDPLADEEYRLALGAADVLLVNEKPGVAAMAVPSKLTSYFDAGRPVIAATDCGGTSAAEVEAARAGLVVPAGDPGALVDAVETISSDVETAARFGSNGRRYRKSVLDERSAIEQWLAAISSLLAAREEALNEK